MNTYTGESDYAAEVASLVEQVKTLKDDIELLVSHLPRNVNAEKETDKLREELRRSVNSHISR
jgi:hypothetical protein